MSVTSPSNVSTNPTPTDWNVRDSISNVDATTPLNKTDEVSSSWIPSKKTIAGSLTAVATIGITSLFQLEAIKRSADGLSTLLFLPTAYLTECPIGIAIITKTLSEVRTIAQLEASCNLLNGATLFAKGILAGRVVEAGFDLFSTVKQLPSELAEIDKKDNSSKSNFLTPKNKALVENMAKAFTAVAPALFSIGLFYDVVHPTKNYLIPLPSSFNDSDLFHFAYHSTLAQYLPTVGYLVSGVAQAIIDFMPQRAVYDFKYTKENLVGSAVAATLPSLVVAATSEFSKAGKRYWNQEKPAPTEK